MTIINNNEKKLLKITRNVFNCKAAFSEGKKKSFIHLFCFFFFLCFFIFLCFFFLYKFHSSTFLIIYFFPFPQSLLKLQIEFNSLPVQKCSFLWQLDLLLKMHKPNKLQKQKLKKKTTASHSSLNQSFLSPTSIRKGQETNYVIIKSHPSKSFNTCTIFFSSLLKLFWFVPK